MRRAAIDPRHAASMYRSLGSGLFELLWLAGRRRRVALGEVARVDAGSRTLLEAARSHGRGIVLGASHTGNWDLAACAIAQDMPLLVVTKNLRIGALDRFWQATRAAFGVRLTTAERALAKGRAHLSNGGAVAMMIDQVPLKRRHGIRAAFLGADAWMDRGPATLAARTGAPLVVAASHRGSGGVHELAALRMLVPPSGAGADWIATATREAPGKLALAASSLERAAAVD